MTEETSRTNVLLEDIQRNIQVLAECYVAQTTKLESFDHRLTNLEATTERIEMRVGVLETKVDRLEIKVDKLEIRFDNLEIRFDNLETKVDKLETKVDKLESFATDTQHRLTGIEDIAVETRGRLVRIETHLGLGDAHRAPARRANRTASQPGQATSQPSRTTRSKKR